MHVHPEENVPLAPLTTFELGGPARYLVEVSEEAALVEAIQWAKDRELPILVLGGGSNLVVGDDGHPGLVIRFDLRGFEVEGRGEPHIIEPPADQVRSGDEPVERHGLEPHESERWRDEVWVRVGAGEPWDEVVRRTVAEGWAGLECLAGIPGRTGATPIQNVGAYGQEVSETIRSVRVLDPVDLRIRRLPPDQCDFGYRDSYFKRNPGRFVVLAVTYGLRPGGEPAVRYEELRRALGGGEHGSEPSLEAVRRTVVELRRRKSMVIDPADPNRRSAGSFFTNPIVEAAEAERIVRDAVGTGLAPDPGSVPRWTLEDGRVKLAAGWLIERAGIEKGTRRGPVGVSTKHCLALVHHGGGTTAQLLELAREIRDRVRDRFGVELVPEPTLVGCALD